MANYADNAALFNPERYPDAKKIKVGIVTAEWNEQVTGKLNAGAISVLKECLVPESHIFQITVPGSFELTAGAQWIFQHYTVDVVICLGCIIQGETRHFEFISQAVANGLTQVELKYGKPVIFGVLTTDTLEQALQRCGGKHGHKGEEAALTAIRMALLDKNPSNKIGFNPR
jgi:6,7-dimethyl-8-ribityllumazine synthase